jgi:hypothetical protein
MRIAGLLFILLLAGCAIGTQEADFENELIIADTLVRFPVSDQTYPQSQAVELFESYDSVRYLCYLNPGKNEILFFFLDSMKLSHKISLAQDGPHGVGKAVGFTVGSLDSIYVTSKGRKILYLVNRNGLLLSNNDYSAACPLSMSSYSTTKTPVFVTDTCLYLPLLPAGNWSTITDKQMVSFNLCLSLNLTRGAASLCTAGYPESAYETRSVQYQWCRGDELYVISFERNDKLYTTVDFAELKATTAKSNFHRKTESPPTNPTPEQYLRYSIETPSYSGIIYDKYRDVYYRICYQGKTTGKDDNLMQLASFKPSYSILILNKHLEVIGETLLSENQFYPEEYFVAKEGFYISENTVFNENYDEDYLTYRLLRLARR